MATPRRSSTAKRFRSIRFSPERFPLPLQRVCLSPKSRRISARLAPASKLFNLRVLQPLLIVAVSCGRLLHVSDALQLGLRFALTVADDRISRNAEFHATQPKALTPRGQIGNLCLHTLRRIAVHDVGIAL